MAWYLHPSNQLRDDELPPELVVTDRDGSIEQAYVPYNDIERLQAENAKLRDLVRDMWRDGMCECDERSTCAQCDYHFPDRMRELGVNEE